MTLSMPQRAVGTPSERASGAAISPYAVKLSVFEGPLDLLLHLIRQNEVEITDIPIAKISEQYLAYLDVMRELNLDVVGDYLVMAATLAWIKSCMLLPPDATDEEGEEVDPRAELVARLLEYQRFKEAAEGLGDRHLLGRDVFDANAHGLEPVPEFQREIEVGLFELVLAFKTVLENAEPRPRSHEIEVEHITVREQMISVMEELEGVESLEFDQVLARRAGDRPSRAVIVAMFLAILELTRLAALRIYQGRNEAGVPRGPIHLRRTFGPGDSGWKRLISEVM
jgi:segregation and condensation protein A